MKRILCIVSSLDTGGAETFLMKIFRKLPCDYKFDFVVSTETGYYENEVRSLGGRIYRIPLRTKHPIASYQALVQIVRENKYQCVLKLCDTPIGVIDLLAAKRGGARQLCVRSCNAASSESTLRKVINGVLRPLLNRTATVKLAPSRLAAEYTFGKQEVDSGYVRFLNNAIDLNVYRFSESGRKRIRAEYGIEDTSFVVGHIGRFNKQKNHRFLIEIFREILNQRPGAKLLLVGNGELSEEVKRQVREYQTEDNVVFCGVRSDVPDLLSAMDVFLFPSLYEGMPNTVIEAQATGLPCVISDTITAEANITGLVNYLPLGDADRWAEAVLHAVCPERMDTRDAFYEAKYDIESSAVAFVKAVFGD